MPKCHKRLLQHIFFNGFQIRDNPHLYHKVSRAFKMRVEIDIRVCVHDYFILFSFFYFYFVLNTVIFELRDLFYEKFRINRCCIYLSWKRDSIYAYFVMLIMGVSLFSIFSQYQISPLSSFQKGLEFDSYICDYRTFY